MIGRVLTPTHTLTDLLVYNIYLFVMVHQMLKIEQTLSEHHLPIYTSYKNISHHQLEFIPKLFDQVMNYMLK